MNVHQSDPNKETVVVTGGNGLIGKKIINRLVGDYNVVGLDKIADPYPPEKAEIINFDITKVDSIRAAMNRVKHIHGKEIASVIHLAAYYDFSGEPSPLYDEVTVKGTKKLLNVLQDYDVEQFIFSSTNLIYKPTEPGKKIDEDSPIEPNWNYPESKENTEKLIREERGNIKATLLRLAGVYDEQGHSIPITNQIKRIYEKELISHFYSGDTSHGNVFLHMEDLLDALEKTVNKRKGLPDEIAINIGEPETPSYDELQDKIGQLIYGKEWETIEIPPPIAKAGAWGMDLFGDPFIKPWMIDRADDHFEFDISRAREMLDWEPRHNLMDTLPAINENLKEDPKAWYKENNLELPSEMEEESG